jgi:hypothetical protein
LLDRQQEEIKAWVEAHPDSDKIKRLYREQNKDAYFNDLGLVMIGYPRPE